MKKWQEKSLFPLAPISVANQRSGRSPALPYPLTDKAFIGRRISNLTCMYVKSLATYMCHFNLFFTGERTTLANQARALLMEQGLIVAKGIRNLRKFLPLAIENLGNGLSMTARYYLSELYAELMTCDELIEKYESCINAFAKNDEACKRLQKIPGVGPITATAIMAHAGDATEYKNGRAFASSLGLTPKKHSSGGKQKLLGVSKRGNSTIRINSGSQDNYTLCPGEK